VQELLVLANGEDNSGIWEWWGQQKTDDAVAQQGTRGRWSRALLTLVLLLHCPCREQLAVPASSSDLNVQNSQPVNS